MRTTTRLRAALLALAGLAAGAPRAQENLEATIRVLDQVSDARLVAASLRAPGESAETEPGGGEGARPQARSASERELGNNRRPFAREGLEAMQAEDESEAALEDADVAAPAAATP